MFGLKNGRTALLGAALLHLAMPAGTMAQAAGRPAMPQLTIAYKGAAGLSGDAAIAALGSNIDAVAAHYGKTVDQLKSLMRTDLSVRLDRTGRIFFSDPEPSALDLARLPAAEPSAYYEQMEAGDAFDLSSNPGASKTIQLNFRGATLPGANWGSRRAGISVPAFSVDSDGDSFTTDEKVLIKRIWKRVAEDFAPFDVNVTTAEVSAENLERASATDKTYGISVLYSNSIPGQSSACGSVAGLESFFGQGQGVQPVIVCYGMSTREEVLAEATSHAIGHALGLSHDGKDKEVTYKGESYPTYSRWAPIMGQGFLAEVTQFSNGDYSGATNQEDDFAVIKANGLAYRTDDVSGSKALVLPVETTGPYSFARSGGVITPGGDVDLYQISASPGMLRAVAEAVEPGGNANLRLRLLNSAGTILKETNSSIQLHATFQYYLPESGIYYLQVWGDRERNRGHQYYSRYGSVGAYQVMGFYVTMGSTAPYATFSPSVRSGPAPLAVAFDPKGSTDDNGISTFKWSFGDGTEQVRRTNSSVNKTYSKPGRYLVKLEVTDGSGYRAVAMRVVTVEAAVAAAARKTAGAP